jgi:hypothetical protein
VSDATIFRETTDHLYPDPLHRMAASFEGVANPASVVCSVAGGYMFGSELTSFAARVSVPRLEWTHGALERDATLGFLASDVPSWNPLGPVRFDDALEPFIHLGGEQPLGVAARQPGRRS